MAISDQGPGAGQSGGQGGCRRGTRWTQRDEVAARLGVGPAHGPEPRRAPPNLLAGNGPNALPVEQPPSPLRRFLAQYTSYMQLILVGAAIVSLAIKEWTTAIVLVVITLFNAVVGLRQAGKAESAMNALQSMMKATARVRRDGAEAADPGRAARRRRRRSDRGG